MTKITVAMYEQYMQGKETISYIAIKKKLMSEIKQGCFLRNSDGCHISGLFAQRRNQLFEKKASIEEIFLELLLEIDSLKSCLCESNLPFCKESERNE